MEIIELLARLHANRKELVNTKERTIIIEEEIAIIEKEIVDFCNTTETYEVVLGSHFSNGILQTVKNAKYVSLFSSRLLNNPDFVESVRGKRYGIFRIDLDFAPVVKFVAFDSSGDPDEYAKGRKAARELAKQGKIIVMFDEEVVSENLD